MKCSAWMGVKNMTAVRQRETLGLPCQRQGTYVTERLNDELPCHTVQAWRPLYMFLHRNGCINIERANSSAIRGTERVSSFNKNRWERRTGQFAAEKVIPALMYVGRSGSEDR